MKTNDKNVWEALHDMHTALGIDRGSSDESDCEPNSKKVIVREKPWHNQQVKAAYKVIDNFCYDFNSSTKLAITSQSVLVFKIECSV